jgi:hypothetical protein
MTVCQKIECKIEPPYDSGIPHRNEHLFNRIERMPRYICAKS